MMAVRPGGTLGLVAAGILLTFFVGFTATYAIPLLDPEMTAVTEFTAYRSPAGVDGKRIYDSEGCWYCHTQQVRGASNDLGLGIVTLPDRVSRDRPSVLGLTRFGPDLSCVGDRFESVAALASHVASPKTGRPASSMPPNLHLSSQELSLLAQYLSELTCGA